MNPIRILIADDNEAFRSNLLDSLSSRFIVEACQTGMEALEKLKAFQPDILVLDLLLRELDGLSLLFHASQLTQPPSVLVTTTFSNDYVKEQLQKLGVDALMLKPCELKAAVSRILQLAKDYLPRTSPLTELIVSRLLSELNIPAHMDGCTQLKAAIPLYAQDPSKPLNKVIYAEVAKKCGYDNPKQVERSIRNAIDKAWNLSSAIWSIYFPNSKPTNKAFIARLAEELNNHLLQDTEPAAK